MGQHREGYKTISVNANPLLPPQRFLLLGFQIPIIQPGLLISPSPLPTLLLIWSTWWISPRLLLFLTQDNTEASFKGRVE